MRVSSVASHAGSYCLEVDDQERNCVREIGPALDSLPPRSEAMLACDQVAGPLAQRPETSNAVMLNDRLGQITDALDRFHEVVCEAYFVSRTHEIGAG